ncbi:MAG: hypothetical protein CL917_07510 [Deltaproteobacteria bacterium]|nr:hypothetical protein [Deltaproteobacteria bacterium]
MRAQRQGADTLARERFLEWEFVGRKIVRLVLIVLSSYSGLIEIVLYSSLTVRRSMWRWIWYVDGGTWAVNSLSS